MLMRVYDEQGKFIREVNDHDVPVVFRRGERIQIGSQLYAIDTVGPVELDPGREVVFRAGSSPLGQVDPCRHLTRIAAGIALFKD